MEYPRKLPYGINLLEYRHTCRSVQERRIMRANLSCCVSDGRYQGGEVSLGERTGLAKYVGDRVAVGVILDCMK